MTNVQIRTPQNKYRNHYPAWFFRRQQESKPYVGGRIGSLEVRLVKSPKELRKAQALRFKVFYQEMAARANTKIWLLRRDEDHFDKICDHLLVLDHSTAKFGNKPKIVGTYRLLRQEIANRNCGFYSENEYNIVPLLKRHNSLKFLELGRSCVLEAYRTKRTVELLWHGIWSYVKNHNIDVLFGCASFPGTDPQTHAKALSFLHYFAKAKNDWTVQALPEHYSAMNLLAKEALSQKEALKTIPPLIKGYLRLGAKIGDGAVIDKQFGTTDVLIILPVSHIDQRYINHYGTEAERFANS